MESKSTEPVSVQFRVRCLIPEGGDSVLSTSIFGPLIGFIVVALLVEARVREGEEEEEEEQDLF